MMVSIQGNPRTTIRNSLLEVKYQPYIDQNGIPVRRSSTKFYLYHNDKLYPPKYVLSIASKVATGKELDPSEFKGGNETNNFLRGLGFIVEE